MMKNIIIKDLEIEEIFLDENINEEDVLNLDFSKEAFRDFDIEKSIKLCVIYPFNGMNVTFTELGVGEVGVGGNNRIYLKEDSKTDIYDYSIIFDKEEIILNNINLNRPREEVKKDIIEKYQNSQNKDLIVKICNDSFNPKSMKNSLDIIERIK